MITSKLDKILGAFNARANVFKYLSVFLLAGLMLVSVSHRASAAYDIIVPTSIEIHTTDALISRNLDFWGWAVAMDNSKTVFDYENALFVLGISDPTVGVAQDFINEAITAPVATGEVGGQSILENVSVFTPFLNGGETPKMSSFGFWSSQFSFTAGYSGSTILNSSVTIGGETISYSTNVDFINDNSTDIVINGAQRLSTTIVPEPISMVLFLTGGGVLAGRRYLKKRKK